MSYLVQEVIDISHIDISKSIGLDTHHSTSPITHVIVPKPEAPSESLLPRVSMHLNIISIFASLAFFPYKTTISPVKNLE